MNRLDVGLDKGRSKTNLAVAPADGRLVLEARIEHFDQIDSPPLTSIGLLQLIAEHLTPFKTHPLSLSLGGHFEAPVSFFDGLSGAGFDVEALEVFTDVHNHYGLTSMPGNAVTVACGSHWNAMYYDQANNVRCFASPCAIWDYLPHSFEGFTFARFLLSWWGEVWNQGSTSPLANEILVRTGLSAATLRTAVKQDPHLSTFSPPRWLALGPLISQHANARAGGLVPHPGDQPAHAALRSVLCAGYFIKSAMAGARRLDLEQEALLARPRSACTLRYPCDAQSGQSSVGSDPVPAHESHDPTGAMGLSCNEIPLRSLAIRDHPRLEETKQIGSPRSGSALMLRERRRA